MNDVPGMIQGCDEAMVSHALTDDMRLVRMVTFYNSKDIDFEIVAGAQNRICQKQGNISISKSLLYSIKSLTKVLKRNINIHAALFKNIPGYTPDPDNTQDFSKHKTY